MGRVVKRLRAVAAVALVAFCFAAVADGRQATYTNPVIAGDFPDPSLVRVGKDYWAVTTSGAWSPHFPLLHSRDLVNWRLAGHVFSERPRWARSDFWAPEIVSDGGRYLVYYTARRDEGARRGTLCVAVAVAPRPEGPYADRGPLVCEIRERGGVGSIDGFFVRDERGRPHLVWKADGNDAEPDQPTSIYAQPLSEDGTRLVGRRREILRNDAPWERHVTEGSYIVRRGGWFYHFYSGNSCCGRECDYALGVARARRLLGPWEKHPRNPILKANEDWKCPGHGSLVTTPDGRDFLLYHSYRRRPETFHVGREGLLDEVTWGADGWPVINAGRGPSNRAASPLGAAQASAWAEVFDDFEGPELSPEWQWPMFVRQTTMVEHEGGSLLVLTPLSNPRGGGAAAAVLARPVVGGSYTVTARVDVRRMTPSALAGLAAYSWRDAAVGVTGSGGKVTAWRKEGNEHRTLASAEAPGGEALFLRLTADGGTTFRFAFSADGRDWTELGGPADGRHIEGARVALTASGGPARFDWVRIKSSRQ